MSTSNNQTEASAFQALKEKTPTWLYRDFILAYFGKKVSNTQNGVGVNTRFILVQEGDFV